MGRKLSNLSAPPLPQADASLYFSSILPTRRAFCVSLKFSPYRRSISVRLTSPVLGVHRKSCLSPNSVLKSRSVAAKASGCTPPTSTPYNLKHQIINGQILPEFHARFTGTTNTYLRHWTLAENEAFPAPSVDGTRRPHSCCRRWVMVLKTVPIAPLVRFVTTCIFSGSESNSVLATLSVACVPCPGSICGRFERLGIHPNPRLVPKVRLWRTEDV